MKQRTHNGYNYGFTSACPVARPVEVVHPADGHQMGYGVLSSVPALPEGKDKMYMHMERKG